MISSGVVAHKLRVFSSPRRGMSFFKPWHYVRISIMFRSIDECPVSSVEGYAQDPLFNALKLKI
jgi:hypothetical protein